jgi:hypothetical protein
MSDICQRQTADLHLHHCHLLSDASSPICRWRSPLLKPNLTAICFNADIVVPRLMLLLSKKTISHGGHHVLDELRKVEDVAIYDFDILLLISTI